jgi:hypothetical protein
MVRAKKYDAVKKQPPKKLNKRKFFSYSDDAIKRALFEIRENNMSTREASRQFGVPRTTIQDRLKGKSPENIVRRTGPPPIMTREGEQKIADWLLDIAKCGFPIKKSELIDTVTKIARDSGKLHLFKNQQPGQKWYLNFLKRHPEISLREAEGINKARALVTEESIKKWFKDLQDFIQSNNLKEAIEDPKRVFNGDESGFSLCPKTGKVLAPKGWKNLYIVTSGKEKENITVFLIFNADGKVCPPFVVFPYIRPPRALVENMPPTWILGKSDKGWMTADAFFEYISNDFNKWIIQEKIPKPVIVFIDGHKSHMSLPLSQFCDANGIVLYALPPNTTHMLQPADVSVFKPLKQEWRTTVRKWLNQPENVNSSVTKLNFCTLFEETLQGTDTTNQIKNGFRKCGLFPLNPENVDYAKCVKNTLEKKLQKPDPETETIDITDLEIAEKVIRKMESKLYTYGVNVQVIYNEIKESKPKQQEITVGTILPLDDLIILPTQNVIFHDTNELQERIESENDVQEDSFQDSVLSNEEINIHGDVTEDPEWNDLNEEIEGTSLLFFPNNETTRETRKEINCNPVQDREDERRSEKKDEGRTESLVEDTILTQHKPRDEIADGESGVLRTRFPPNKALEKNVDPFEAHLSFPEATKKLESKTPKAKLPSAISSQAWRNYYLKKEQEKNDKINQVKLRKEQREAKKRQKQIMTNSKKKKKPERKTEKRSLKNKEDTETTIEQQKEKVKCALCEEDLISDTEDDLEKNIGCDYCTKWYHFKCTDFLDLTYEVAASKDYKCDMCK